MSIFGALGDIHGAFEAARTIMERHPEVPFWLCVGDVADAEGRYESLPAPLYWIKGNNENFDAIASGELPANLHHIPNGEVIDIDGLRVAGLGGTFAPTMYELAAADLPHRTPLRTTPKAPAAAASGESSSSAAAARGGGAPRALKNDRRRHFVREEVERCTGMTGIDIFLSHEAPRPFRVHRGIDAGKTPVNEVLKGMKPRLHLFGHHHRFVAAEVSGVRSVCLELVSDSYLLIDPKTLEYQHLPVK